MLENSVDYIAAYYGVLKIGAVATPLNPSLKPDGLMQLLKHLRPSVVMAGFKSERLLAAVKIHESDLKIMILKSPRSDWKGSAFKVATFEEALNGSGRSETTVPIGEEDLASIIYTSGSTGKPKGVMLTHKNIVQNTLSICSYLSITNKDIQMIVLPFFYVMGKSLLNTHIAKGASVVLNNKFMYPADVVHQMLEEKVTAFSGVPSTYAYLLNKSPLMKYRNAFESLRYCTQAGGHMSKAIKIELRKTLPEHTQIIVMYGATEASARLTYLSADKYEAKMESIGKPIPNVIVRIVDENGNEVPKGVEGELVASGPNIMMGYWQDPDDTARVLKDNDYYTGDIGYRDEDGYLFVTRRKDDIIKVGGHRINPVEIEDCMMETGELIEVSVVGISDDMLGNKLVALVVPKNDTFSEQSFLLACAAKLPKHKQPAEIKTMRTLPKNANGKIEKDKCRQIAHSNGKPGFVQ